MRVDTVVQQENLHRLDADEQDLPAHNSEGFVASGGRTSLIKMCLKSSLKNLAFYFLKKQPLQTKIKTLG